MTLKNNLNWNPKKNLNLKKTPNLETMNENAVMGELLKAMVPLFPLIETKKLKKGIGKSHKGQNQTK